MYLRLHVAVYDALGMAVCQEVHNAVHLEGCFTLAEMFLQGTIVLSCTSNA